MRLQSREISGGRARAAHLLLVDANIAMGGRAGGHADYNVPPSYPRRRHCDETVRINVHSFHGLNASSQHISCWTEQVDPVRVHWSHASASWLYRVLNQGAKVCRYNWHRSSAKILIYFQNIRAILSNNTRKLLWLEITKMLIVV